MYLSVEANRVRQSFRVYTWNE